MRTNSNNLVPGPMDVHLNSSDSPISGRGRDSKHIFGYIPLLRVKSKGASVRKLRPSIVTKQNIDLANLKNDSLTRIS